MQIIYSEQDFLHNVSSIAFGVMTARDNGVKQLSTSNPESKMKNQMCSCTNLQLHNEVDAILRFKQLVQLNDVFVAHLLKDIDFTLNHALFASAFLSVDYFDGVSNTGFTMDGFLHFRESATKKTFLRCEENSRRLTSQAFREARISDPGRLLLLENLQHHLQTSGEEDKVGRMMCEEKTNSKYRRALPEQTG